ncbi:TonB-dependent receptor plug domain-containing protein [Bowmanella denitrificans]|uniref:TonB-dependent receptor plug domain-containing protein n=1 Tax=Bowmanella denitrificans TaxID=366582 RepID=UPI001559107D|nr:TonB-dependent receptor [Bowmanella denitrificans]
MHQVRDNHNAAPFRYSLLALSVLGLVPAVQAQAQQTSEQNMEMEVIDITGSRIRRTDIETHTPVVSFSADDIVKTGTINIGELLNELPSMVPAGGTETSNANGYAGLSRQDLRGLGSTRTLVLVNGRRHVPSVPGTSEVDVSSIPTALIERIDVLTGGASSIYGADAVSGVVNIILKKNFTGTEISASYNSTGEFDGKRWYATMTHGQPFADGNGHINYHLSYQTSDEVEARTRGYVANDLTFIDNPNADAPGQVKRITAHRSPLYASSQRLFLLDGRPFGVNPDGSLKPMLADGQEVYGTSTTQLAALTVDSSNDNFYTRYQWGRLAVPEDKLNANLNLNREIADGVDFSAELKYVKTKSESRTEPLAEYGVTPLPADYAFYTDAQRQEVTRTGQGLLFGGYFPEMGRQGSDYDYGLYQAVLALEGLTDDNYRWQLSAQHGQTKVKTTSINDYSQENWEKAVWGGYQDPETSEWRTCDANCVPVNVFQPLSQDAIDYLKIAPHQSSAKLTQSVFAASLDGELFELPAGFMGFAIGAEHRREKSDSTPSDVQLAGLGAFNFKAKPLSGDYHVSEAFAELRAPLLSDVLLAKSLELNGAWRTARYSTAGTNHSWTVGLDWMPTDELKIRASRAKAARAPNINEIYQSESQRWNYVYEVCYSSYRKNGSEYREANCDARGLNDPANYYNNALIITSGNEELKAERAYTFTGGLVYAPEYIDNLSLTVDYWDINLVDKIGTLDWSQIYPNCMDSASLDNIFCDLIEYQDGYTQLNVSYLNLAMHETRGVDYALDYRFSLPDSGVNLSLRSNWSRMLQRDLQSDPNAEIEQTLGEMAFPKWRGRTTFTAQAEDVTLTLTGHYIGSQVPDLSRDPADYSVYATGRLWYLDFGLNYQFNNQTSVNLYVSNLSGRETPQIPGANTGGASWEMGYTAGLYSTLGRYYSLSVNHRF